MANEAVASTGRSYRRIVADNLFTFFNIVLFGLAFALLLLGSPRDAFFTGGIALLNTVVATAQEARAKRTLDRITLLTLPQATVIRDGQQRAISPAEVVAGDTLVAAPGDQIIVDGVVSAGRADLDESLLTGEAETIPKEEDAPVLSGSYVLAGRIAYEAQKVGRESYANTLTARAREFSRELTPLQREVNLVVRILLLLVVAFGVMLFVENYLSAPFEPLQAVQATSVVFGLAPSSLFLMIVVAYALGAVRIAEKGALVQRSNAVESLSYVDVLCLDKTGTLTANKLQMQELLVLGDEDEVTVRRALGVYARSASFANHTSEAIAAACPGEALATRGEVPFSSGRKWSALAFDDNELRGTYVLGAPESLSGNGVMNPNGWGDAVAQWAEGGNRVLAFARAPEVTTLQSGNDPTLPSDLRPLALLRLVDELRPDARDTLDGFRRAGVVVKIISGDNPQTVAALARQAGLEGDGRELQLYSGPELDGLDDDEFRHAALQGDIFGRVVPEQKQRLVKTLRESGHYVAMTGDGINDVLALKQSKLGIAMQSGTAAARGVADIVLLGDSFAALPEAFLEGQRILSGMSDILRLYLTRILTLALTIGMLAIMGVGFPYSPAQNAIISIFVLAVPSLALAVWAKPSPLPRSGIIRPLMGFVLPATVATSLALLGVYMYFILTTGDWLYTQLALTYATITTGLLLIVFVEPPSPFWAGGVPLSGDRRPALLALALFLVLILSPYLPILNSFFGLAALRSLAHWAVIGVVTLVWLFVLRLMWRRRVIDRYLDVDLQTWRRLSSD